MHTARCVISPWAQPYSHDILTATTALQVAEHAMQSMLDAVAVASALIARCRGIDAQMEHVDAMLASVRELKVRLSALEAALGI